MIAHEGDAAADGTYAAHFGKTGNVLPPPPPGTFEAHFARDGTVLPPPDEDLYEGSDGSEGDSGSVGDEGPVGRAPPRDRHRQPGAPPPVGKGFYRWLAYDVISGNVPRRELSENQGLPGYAAGEGDGLYGANCSGNKRSKYEVPLGRKVLGAGRAARKSTARTARRSLASVGRVGTAFFTKIGLMHQSRQSTTQEEDNEDEDDDYVVDDEDDDATRQRAPSLSETMAHLHVKHSEGKLTSDERATAESEAIMRHGRRSSAPRL